MYFGLKVMNLAHEKAEHVLLTSLCWLPEQVVRAVKEKSSTLLYFFFSLNIYGFYLTYISTYNIHTENTSGHQRTFISCIPSDDITHDFESYWMKDVPGSISHVSPQVAGDQRISSLWTTRSCTALPHNVSFLMKTKNGFQEPC